MRAINDLLVYNNRIGAKPYVDGGIAPPMQYKKGAGTETSSVPGMPEGRMAGITQVSSAGTSGPSARPPARAFPFPRLTAAP